MLLDSHVTCPSHHSKVTEIIAFTPHNHVFQRTIFNRDVTTHESCPVERVVCGGRRHAYALGLGYIQHSTPTDAMEPLPMDRVGIDGLDGPGRSRRLIHGQSSSGRSRTNFAGTSSTSLQTSRRQFTPQREPETNTLTDGYDSRQLKQLSMRSLHRGASCGEIQ